jgi:hypothetical protein
MQEIAHRIHYFYSVIVVAHNKSFSGLQQLDQCIKLYHEMLASSSNTLVHSRNKLLGGGKKLNGLISFFEEAASSTSDRSITSATSLATEEFMIHLLHRHKG